MTLAKYDNLGALLHAGIGQLGAIGKLGNTSSIAAGTYDVSGDGVALRSGPSFAAGVVTRLNQGDQVDVPEGAELPYDASSGADPNFPRGVAVYFTPANFGNVSGYIATGYLSPLGTVPRADGGGGAVQPASYTPPDKKTPDTAAKGSDYTVPLLIGATVLGVGVIGWAIFWPKKKK